MPPTIPMDELVARLTEAPIQPQPKALTRPRVTWMGLRVGTLLVSTTDLTRADRTLLPAGTHFTVQSVVQTSTGGVTLDHGILLTHPDWSRYFTKTRRTRTRATQQTTPGATPRRRKATRRDPG